MTNSPETPSQHFPLLKSSLGESGFLPHRPMSEGIDTITQGFRFAAPGKKSPIATGGGGRMGMQDTKSSIATQERSGSDVDIGGGSNPNRIESLDFAALKVPVPIFPPTSALHPPSPLLPPIATAASFADEQMMLPPSPSLRLNDRGRNNRMAREKRKHVDSSNLITPNAGGRTQASHRRLVNNSERRRFEISETRDEAPKTSSRGAELSGSGMPSDERRSKKLRQNKPIDPSRPSIAPTSPTPMDESKGLEIIVLDDDVKVELADSNASMAVPCRKVPSDTHSMDMGALVRSSESLQRRGTFQVYADQPTKHHALQLKDSNRRIGAGSDTPNEITGTLNSHSVGEGTRRVNGRVTGSNRSSAINNDVVRKISRNGGRVIESQPQEPSSRTLLTPSSTTISQENEYEQRSTGEHKLLVALTTLTTEKQILEKKLHETIVSFETQVFRAESLERQNSELKAQVQTSKENIAGLKKKMIGFQKFIDGLGKDYNMLSEKNSQINNRLDEVLRDRNELFRGLQDVRCLAEKVDGTVQGWGSSEAMLKDANREIEKLNETLKFLHSQLSENAGLLAAERDRTQSLESQIQSDKKMDKTVLTAIQGGKLELAEKLTEFQRTFKTNTELELEGKLTELRKTIAIKIEVDGETTRNSVSRCFKTVEKLRDRELDALECLTGVEKRINHTSDSIMGLFHETHKMNAEALSFTDGYIGHLNSRIKDLEVESREMREKYEVSLIVSAEKKQLEKELEQQLKMAIENCNEMSRQIEVGKTTENCLNESISALRKKLVVHETRPTEDIALVEAIENLKQKNSELRKECELARNDAQNANSLLQSKDSELESLRTELQSLVTKCRKSEDRIEGFENEKAEFMACAEEQKMKERIDVETNANMFRQRETSRLNNQIKALEAQKDRLETENKGLRIAATDASDITLDLRKEVTKLQKMYSVMEKTHLELIQEKTQFENLAQNSTQLEAATRSRYSILEGHTETTSELLSKALEQIDTFREDKKLMSEEIHSKQQELERTNSVNYELRTAAEDAATLRTVERQLRDALKEADAEKGMTRREKEEVVNAYQALREKTKLLEERFEALGDANEELKGRSLNTMANLNEELEALRKDNEKLTEANEGVLAELKRVSKPARTRGKTTEIPTEHEGHDTEQQVAEESTTVVDKSVKSWDGDSQPLSPITSLERILETQMDAGRMDDTIELGSESWGNFSRIDNAKFERYLFGDDDDIVNVEDLAKDVLEVSSKAEVQADELLLDAPPTNSWIKGVKKPSKNSQPRKNMATKFTSHRRMPSMAPDSIDDQTTAVEESSGDSENKVSSVGISLSQNIYLEQTSSAPITPKPHIMEEKDSKNRKKVSNSESTPVERYSFTPATPPNKPRTPQRNDSRGPADDIRKIQHRPRKERSKKSKDDQEWVEEEAESVRSIRGKEDTSNMKRSLRSYKERKKGGKRFI